MLLTTRDGKVLNFICRFRAVTAPIIGDLFFQGVKHRDVMARRSLRRLWVENKVKRMRLYCGEPYVYYVQKAAQIKHRLTVTRLFHALYTGPGRIIEFIPEYPVGSGRADAFFTYQVGDMVYLYFVEVQLNNCPVELKKYEATAGDWPVRPRLLVVSDRKTIPKNPSLIQTPVSYESLFELIL